jgi:hypothetical protein
MLILSKHVVYGVFFKSFFGKFRFYIRISLTILMQEHMSHLLDNNVYARNWTLSEPANFSLFAFGQQQSCLPKALESLFDPTHPDPDFFEIGN